MGKPTKAAAPADRAAHYARLIALYPAIELKGAANPYTSLNGNMFSYLHPSGSVALRLAPGDREQFLKHYASKLFEAYGVVQKEYVTIPDSLLERTAELQPWFERSFEYAKTLKPKPTKKKPA